VVTALAAALAVLLWPPVGVRQRTRVHRLSARTHRPSRAPAKSRPVPLPAAAAGVATLLGAALSTPLVAGLAGVLAGLAGRAWSVRRGTAAEEARLLALVRGLGALAADLRSGRSLAAATEAAAAACGDEWTGRELIRAVRAPDRPPPESAGEPVARISGAVLLSGRTGCSLADVLGALEDDLRARHRHELELRATTAGPRAGALLLAGLPVLGLAMGGGVGADPWRVLTTTGTGQVLLVAGVALEVAGVLWVARLVRRAVR
jgi:tight adherence protein B